MKQITIGQGQGMAGRFGGLRDPFGSEASAGIVILPVPFDKTSTYQLGSRNGPKALIEASRNLELYDIETNSEVYKKGIYTASNIVAKSSEAMIQATYTRVKRNLKNGKFVVVVGGEHTVSYGAIQAYSEQYKHMTVLQLDAHADLQKAYEGNPWSHASVMARVRELKTVDRVVSVGIRSMSSEELVDLDSEHTFFAHTLDREGKWMKAVLAKLKGPIYLTFDLDFFDPALLSATGTPEPGGLFWNETMEFLKWVFKTKQVVGFDVVELCPQKGNPASDYIAAKLIYKLLSYKFM